MDPQESAIPSVDSLPPQQRKRREKIVDVALALVSKGKGNVEMRDVAKRSGVALGTLYRYFGSKEVLFAEVYLSWRVRHLDELAAIASRGRSNGERIRAALHRSVEFFVQAPQFLEMAIAMRSSRHPDIVAHRREVESRTWCVFREMLGELKAEDTEGIVSILRSVFFLYMMEWHAGDVTVEGVHQAIDEAVRLTVDVRQSKVNGRAEPAIHSGTRKKDARRSAGTPQ